MKPSRDASGQWHHIERLVDRISDPLGKRVDPLIKSTVTGLIALGFITEGSCQGHLPYGVRAPWVDIGRNLPRRYVTLFDKFGPPPVKEGLTLSDAIFAKYPKLVALRDTNLHRQHYLRRILADFYQRHRAATDCRLALKEKGCFGVVRLQPTGTSLQESRSPKQQAAVLATYQLEMQEFAAFLRRLCLPAAGETREYL